MPAALKPSCAPRLAPCMQGTQHERELAAGGSRALRWSDVLRPLRLCVRVQVRLGPAREPHKAKVEGST